MMGRPRAEPGLCRDGGQVIIAALLPKGSGQVYAGRRPHLVYTRSSAEERALENLLRRALQMGWSPRSLGSEPR